MAHSVMEMQGGIRVELSFTAKNELIAMHPFDNQDAVPAVGDVITFSDDINLHLLKGTVQRRRFDYSTSAGLRFVTIYVNCDEVA